MILNLYMALVGASFVSILSGVISTDLVDGPKDLLKCVLITLLLAFLWPIVLVITFVDVGKQMIQP